MRAIIVAEDLQKCGHGQYTTYWIGRRDTHRFFPTATTDKNHQGEKSRRNIHSYATGIVIRHCALDSVWYLSKRYAHHCYQFFFVAVEYHYDLSAHKV